MKAVWDSLTAREVIGGLLDASNVRIEASIATELRVKNAVLKPGRIQEVDVELAVDARRCYSNSRTDGCNHAVEDESEAMCKIQSATVEIYQLCLGRLTFHDLERYMTQQSLVGIRFLHKQLNLW